MRTKREELAWAGGFYCGEGSICHNGPQRKVPQLQILQVLRNGRDTLDRFRRAVDLGKVYGPYNFAQKKDGTFMRAHTYKVTGVGKVQAIVKMLWPWLSKIKKEQAKRILSYYK